MGENLKNKIGKILLSHPIFSVLITLALLGSISVTINALQQNQDRRTRAEVIATVPGSYGYGGFGASVYGSTSSSSGVTPPTNPTATSVPQATATPLPTATPTTLLPTSTPFPTPTPTTIPTPTPTKAPTAIPTNIPTPTPGINGLLGTYYATNNLSGTPKLTRTDPFVYYNWGSGSPHSSIPINRFSVRWTGYVVPKYSQTYTFYTLSDDGVRLWVNGVQVVNNWTNHSSTENKGTITLTAGRKYSIKLEYYEQTGGSIIGLFWSSASQAKQTIPQSQLFKQ